ncbi:putative lipoprotein [Xylella phage Sano]|uniref:Putative lipoprotein n=1 Tax=Xylella phage Sano TaxID=1415148 RepID=V5Q7J6_9CAUD|nr:putative lipoprotein [Xylella phage Sano]AHB12094.1 putative lipoprotein [Xylella phage Sano]
MSTINAKKLAAAIVLIIEAVGGTSSNSSVNESEDGGDEEEAPKRGRGRPAGSTKKAPAEKAAPKGKGKSKPDPLDDEDEEEGDGDEDEGDDDLGLEDDEEEVTQEELVASFKALKSSHGVDACKKVLALLDESNVLNIPAKKYPEAMKEIKRAASRKK